MLNGGASRDRTADPLLAKQVLSQLSYSPNIWVIFGGQKNHNVCYGFFVVRKLVGLGGFEPPTSPLSGVRSNQLSYRPGIHRPGLHLVSVISDGRYVLYIRIR